MPTTFRACLNSMVNGCTGYSSRNYCDRCERERERVRNAEKHRGVYSLPAWFATRMERFRLDNFTCVDCGWRDDTETGERLHGDHEPDLVELIEAGRSPFDVDYVRTRCHSCHSKKTARATNEKKARR